MKRTRFADLINLPAPFEEDENSILEYVGNYARPVAEQYQKFLIKVAEEGSDQETEFQEILNFGRTRGLGGIVQSMDLAVPIPLPITRVGPSETPSTLRKGKGKGKA